MVQTSPKHQENPSEYLIYRPLLQIITNRPPCRPCQTSLTGLVQVADTPEQINKELIWKLYLYGPGTNKPQTSYYVCTRFGGILSRDKFTDIFGEEYDDT